MLIKRDTMPQKPKNTGRSSRPRVRSHNTVPNTRPLLQPSRMSAWQTPKAKTSQK